MVSKKTRAFRDWQKRMGYTQKEVARSLDMSVSGVRYYCAGGRRDKKGDVSKKVEIPIAILLACAALEAKLSPIGM